MGTLLYGDSTTLRVVYFYIMMWGHFKGFDYMGRLQKTQLYAAARCKTY